MSHLPVLLWNDLMIALGDLDFSLSLASLNLLCICHGLCLGKIRSLVFAIVSLLHLLPFL